MGNLLELSPSNYLLSEVSSPLTLLENCNINKGSIPEIIYLQRKIAKMDITKGFFVPVSQLSRIFKKSPIENHYSVIETYFNNAKFQKVNIMEVMACLITYSSCSLEEKVKLALDIFDLDGNEVITKDEMAIMCISFMRGIAIITQSSMQRQSVAESLADQAFYMADSDPDGMITYEELLEWVKENQVLFQLFTKTQPKVNHQKRKSLIEMHGFQLTKQKMSVFEKKPQIRTSSDPRKSQYVNMGKIGNLQENIKIFQDHFQRILKSKGKVTAKDFFDVLNSNFLYMDYAEKFEKLYHKKMNLEITWEEIKFLVVQRSKTKNNTVGAPVSKQIEEVNTEEKKISEKKISVIRALFDKYDQNKDGLISLQELKNAFHTKFSFEVIESMFHEHDKNKKGFLDFQDFLRLYSS